MNAVVPWGELIALTVPYYPEGRTRRMPFPLGTMLRVHFIQKRLAPSNPAMLETLLDTPIFPQVTN